MKIKWLLDTARCLQNPPRRGHNVDLDEGRAAEGQPEQVRKNKGLNFAPFHLGKKPLKRFEAFASLALLYSSWCHLQQIQSQGIKTKSTFEPKMNLEQQMS